MSLCAELASLKSISLASARRNIEIIAAQEGVRDPLGKKTIAERLIKEIKSELNGKSGDATYGNQLDQLLEALSGEDNFMTED